MEFNRHYTYTRKLRGIINDIEHIRIVRKMANVLNFFLGFFWSFNPEMIIYQLIIPSIIINIQVYVNFGDIKRFLRKRMYVTVDVWNTNILSNPRVLYNVGMIYKWKLPSFLYTDKLTVKKVFKTKTKYKYRLLISLFFYSLIQKYINSCF